MKVFTQPNSQTESVRVLEGMILLPFYITYTPYPLPAFTGAFDATPIVSVDFSRKRGKGGKIQEKGMH
jgi:hypothetical protein